MTMAVPAKRGMTRKQRRLVLIGLAGIVLAVAAGLVLYAMTDRIVFFTAPSELAAKPPPPGCSACPRPRPRISPQPR